MSLPSLLLPCSHSYGDPRKSPRSSKEIRSPSISQWDSFKVVVNTPEPSPLPASLAEELPMYNEPEKPSKKKKPGYFWGIKHKYWIYVMVLIGVLSLASIVGGATARAAAMSKMNGMPSSSPTSTKMVTMTMMQYHHHSRHHETTNHSSPLPAPAPISIKRDLEQAEPVTAAPTLIPTDVTTAVMSSVAPATTKTRSRRAIRELNPASPTSRQPNLNLWAGPTTIATFDALTNEQG